jgi:DNA repair exonuclease SbcCD ATPase subunit
MTFNDSNFDLITGGNGNGKTSWVQSLTYCLFGKIPKLKISELINTTNGEDLYTEVEFTKKSEVYKVIRGEKPKLFEIYKNGELIDQKAKNLDYQEMLEKEILGINLQSFQMLVSIDTSLLNKSFITMSSSERRDFLETILDIKILYFINQVIGTRLSIVKTQKTELEYKLRSRQDVLETERKKYDDIVRINKELTANGNRLAEDANAKVESLREKLDRYKEAFQRIKMAEELLIESSNRLKIIDSKLTIHKTETKKHEKELLRLKAIKEAAVQCVKCGHENASEDVSEETLALVTKTISELNHIIDGLTEECDAEIAIYENHEKIIKEKARLRVNASTTKDEYDRALEDLERAKNFKLLPANYNDVTALEQEICLLETDYEKTCSTEDNLVMIKKLASDDGIKKKLFEKYIPLFNIYVNEHLAEFNVQHVIIFNDKFEITIYDRNEERSFYTFSASERMRINLAVMFGFLKLIENRNGTSMNIMLIDELLDNALSAEITNLVLRFIKYKITAKNRMVISHKTDLDLELFDRHFNVSKENGFSKLELSSV